MAPRFQLAGKIGLRLPGERRAGRAKAFPLLAMAGRAGRDAAPGIPPGEQDRRFGRGLARPLERQRRVIGGDAEPVGLVKPPRNPAHLGMVPATVGKGLELACKIAGIEARKSRRARAVPLALETMTGNAGVPGAGFPAAQRDHFPGLAESIRRARVDRRAASQHGSGEGEDQQPIAVHRRRGTCAGQGRFPGAGLSRFAVAALALAALACKPPPEEGPFLPLADASRGKQAIERVGCGSCHTIEGIDWPAGKAAPELRGFADRGLIAGRVPNRPDLLLAFIRNAPAVAPGTTMPPMPVTEQEARDIAAYLYELEG